MDPKDFPKSIADLKNRSDFDLVYPFDVLDTMTSIAKDSNLSRKLVDTYLYLFSKAFITIARINGITSVAETLLNISEAKDIRVTTYLEPAYRDKRSLSGIIFEATFNMEPNKVVNLRKFVSICQYDCVATMELFGKQKFIRKPFKPESLLRLVKFWYQVEPNIATFRFSKFLGSVVQAGLHDFATNHYEKFERLKLLDSIGELRKVELKRRTGFFSLTFLGGNANVNNQEISGDLHAFGGVFIVSALYSIDYTFEVLLPRTHFFDANLNAFLSPFSLQVWICMVTAILLVSIWLIFARKQCFEEVAFWQLSSILEQDCNGLVNKKILKGFTLTTLWGLLLFSMRQFYCSSLYSFMAAEMDPKDFPKSIAELRNRSDFDLVYPFDVFDTMTYIGLKPNLSRKLVDTCLYLFSKAFITTARFQGITSVAETLLNISEAKEIRVRTYEKTSYRDTQSLHDVLFNASFNWKPNKVVNLRKFVSICQYDCVATMELFGKQRFIRKPFKQESLLRLSRFWCQFEPNIATFRFSRFLGSVVQSGIHDLTTNHYEKFERLKLLDSIGELRKGELGSRRGFFSLTFFGGNANKNNEETPGDLNAFGGVFIVSALVILLAVFVFMVEVCMSLN
ncbi:unnamed protein product [Orchesella dallaii]|uniref:Uncharacterized protein n=1 Tax=Orchesella dallaii TaxID=48710 RepID=A0ABP1RPW3_9HEXA